jgi:hypothetical protein
VTRCPSDLALEAHVLEAARSPLASHLDACANCRERLARMEREGEEFRRFVFPRTVDAVMDAATRPRPSAWTRWLAVGLPAGGFAALAAAMLLVSPQPPSEYLGAKGPSITLQVFAGGGEGPPRAVSDGEVVPASAAIRFLVRSAQPCRLWIVSVDAKGEVSRIFPAQGDATPVQGAVPLPGGAVLDGIPGPERLFAVCSEDPLPLVDVERAARAAAGSGPEAVRRGSDLRGLPGGASAATVLLEKAP